MMCRVGEEVNNVPQRDTECSRIDSIGKGDEHALREALTWDVALDHV